MADDALTPEQRAEMIWHAECAIPGWGVKVEALLDRLEAAEARVEEIDEEREDWETSHRDLAEHHAALSEFARSMAAAIGWEETPGDSWVEKALNWRHDPESLPGLYAELNRLRPIATALAAISGDDVLTEAGDACSLCSEGPGDFDHDPRCPWALAKDWAAIPGAVAGEPGGEACGHEWTTQEPQECNRPAHQDGHHGPDCSATIGHNCALAPGHPGDHRCGFKFCSDPIHVVAGEPESTPAAALLAHAARLAADPQIEATCAEIDRRLAAGEPLDDLLGPGVTADEFRRQYLAESTPAAEPEGCPACEYSGLCPDCHPRAADTQEAP